MNFKNYMASTRSDALTVKCKYNAGTVKSGQITIK
jgi:hypothetical protein